MSAPVAILGVDGGNSKSEIVLAARDGTVLARRRGPTISHQSIAPGHGLTPAQRASLGMERLAQLTRDAAREAGLVPDANPLADVAVLCLAGADLPSDVRLLGSALAAQHLLERPVILNDSFAPLRAGTERHYGISLICGAGINAAAIAPDGRTAGFPGLGTISGDWGGASGLGMAGLVAAVRARDGRGPRTLLEELVPRHFGVMRPATVTRRLYEGGIDEERVRELAPVVFEAAIGGDRVARGIVDHLADELATMAIALARRLGMTRTAFDVVLAGGIFRTRDRGLFDRIAERVATALPHATLRRLDAPPVLGAALLALDHLPGADPGAEERLRAGVVAWDPPPDAAA